MSIITLPRHWHTELLRRGAGPAGPRCLTHVESAPLAVTMESTKTRGPQQGAALMKRTTKYVALDVHQATTSASVREESGRVIARSVLPTDGAAITEGGTPAPTARLHRSRTSSSS